MPDVEDLESTDTYDQYIVASVMLVKDDDIARALLTSRRRDSDGNIMRSCRSNPFLDTHVYEFQFQDGPIRKYTANLISEKLIYYINPGGDEFILLKDILDHRSTNKAVNPEDAFEGDPEKRNYKKTMAGWELLLQWDDKNRSQ